MVLQSSRGRTKTEQGSPTPGGGSRPGRDSESRLPAGAPHKADSWLRTPQRAGSTGPAPSASLREGSTPGGRRSCVHECAGKGATRTAWQRLRGGAGLGRGLRGNVFTRRCSRPCFISNTESEKPPQGSGTAVWLACLSGQLMKQRVATKITQMLTI